LAPLGVAASHTRPYSPRSNGKVERFHQTVQKWLAKQPPAATIAELQTQLDRFRNIYNYPAPPPGPRAPLPCRRLGRRSQERTSRPASRHPHRHLPLHRPRRRQLRRALQDRHRRRLQRTTRPHHHHRHHRPRLHRRTPGPPPHHRPRPPQPGPLPRPWKTTR
jgi:hypothetical protein